MKFSVTVDRVHDHPADTTSEGRVLCTNFASSLLDIYWITSNTGVAAHDFRNLTDEWFDESTWSAKCRPLSCTQQQ